MSDVAEDFRDETGLSRQMEPFTPLVDTHTSLERRTENGHEAVIRIVHAVTADQPTTCALNIYGVTRKPDR